MKELIKKHPRYAFAVYSFGIQMIMWLIFIFYDFGFDERHLVRNKELTDVLGLVLLIYLLISPIAAYFLLKRKFFSTDRPIIDCIFHIVCWLAVSILISAPIVWAVDKDVWIIPQDNSYSSGFINLDGIEYVYIPIIEKAVTAVMLVFSLLPAVIKSLCQKISQS